MMWDFASSSNNQQYPNPYDQDTSPSPPSHRGAPPSMMPSPSFPAAAPGSSYDSTYSSSAYGSSYSNTQSTSSFLAIPNARSGINMPRAASVEGFRVHHHSHEHQQHQRHHSNPGNAMPPIAPGNALRPPVHHQAPRPASSYNPSYNLPYASHSAQNLSRPVPPVPVPQQQSRPPPAQHDQVYSKCTGRKKALCIGINYIGHPRALRGCINDARHVHNFLIRRWGYKDEDIVVLTDDNKNPRMRPTRANMIDAMRWLVKDARPNDSLFFHYSGHGGQTRDLDGDEIDGFDEVLYPVDFEKAGHLTDDLIHRILVSSLPRGCRLTALFDCCHSGTVLDMPYIYQSNGRLKGLQVTDKVRRAKSTNADVITWSGSKDEQTSADTFAGGVAVGAMSYAFITSLSANPKQTYQELLKSVRKILYEKYSQKPQLSSSHHIDTNIMFVM